MTIELPKSMLEISAADYKTEFLTPVFVEGLECGTQIVEEDRRRHGTKYQEDVLGSFAQIVSKSMVPNPLRIFQATNEFFKVMLRLDASGISVLRPLANTLCRGV